MLFRSADFTLIEDDGAGANYKDVRAAHTRLTWSQSERTFTVHATQGARECVPSQREWKITFLSLREKGAKYSVSGTIASDQTSSFRLDVEPRLATPDKNQQLFEILNRAQCSNTSKEHIWQILQTHGNEFNCVQGLRAIDVPPALLDAISEVLGAV